MDGTSGRRCRRRKRIRRHVDILGGVVRLGLVVVLLLLLDLLLVLRMSRGINLVFTVSLAVWLRGLLLLLLQQHLLLLVVMIAAGAVVVGRPLVRDVTPVVHRFVRRGGRIGVSWLLLVVLG